jgi:predicted nuclease of predicted toxin-antitoxin system
MKIELFLDEDVHSGLAHALRKRGYDAIHAQELDRKGRSDSDQLLFAVQQERCLFTYNVRDFVILHNQHAKSRQQHWGIIVSKQLPFTETISRLLRLLQRTAKETMKNHKNRPDRPECQYFTMSQLHFPTMVAE